MLPEMSECVGLAVYFKIPRCGESGIELSRASNTRIPRVFSGHIGLCYTKDQLVTPFLGRSPFPTREDRSEYGDGCEASVLRLKNSEQNDNT